MKHAGPSSQAAGAAAPRRAWPRVRLALLALLALFAVALVVAAVGLADFFAEASRGFDLRIDGERVLSVPSGEASLALLVALVVAALLVAVGVPLAIVSGLVIAAVGIAVAAAVVMVVLAVLLSPLWVPLLLLFLVLREPRPAAAAAPPAGPQAQG